MESGRWKRKPYDPLRKVETILRGLKVAVIGSEAGAADARSSIGMSLSTSGSTAARSRTGSGRASRRTKERT